MNSNVSDSSINEYGRYDELKDSVDKKKAKLYFESIEGTALKEFYVNVKVRQLLKKFIKSGGFELEQADEEQAGGDC